MYGKFHKVECEMDGIYIAKNHSCYVRPVSRNVSHLEAKVRLLRTVHVAHISGQILKKDTYGYQPMFNATVEGCEFIMKGLKERVLTNVLTNIVADYIIKSTSLNHKCPYSPGPLQSHYLKIPNLPIPFLTTADFLLILSFRLNNRKVDAAVLKIYVSYENRKYSWKRT